MAAYSVMGTHYHPVVQFEAYRTLSPEQLRECVLLLYPYPDADIDDWPQAK